MALAASTDTPLPALTEVDITSLIGTPYIFRNIPGSIDAIAGQLKRITLRVPILSRIASLQTYRGSTFTFEGNRYRIVDILGDPSAYGTLFKIKNGNQEYVLKIQKAMPGMLTEQKNIIEGLIQHIVYESTKDRNHFDCAYAPKIYGIFKMDIYSGKLDGVYTAYIQEKLTNTVGSFVAVNTSAASEHSITTEFVKLARKLQNLWVMYQFNHCDFHSGNAMYVEDISRNKSWRIIDFGKSLMNFNGNLLGAATLDVDEPANGLNEGRDLTHLMAFFKNSDALHYRHEIPRYVLGIQTDANETSFLETDLALQRPIVTMPIINGYWGAITWFNNINNTRVEGNAISILTRFNSNPPFITDTRCIDPSGPGPEPTFRLQQTMIGLGFLGLLGAAVYYTQVNTLQAGGHTTLLHVSNSMRNKRNYKTVSKKLNNRMLGRNNKTKSMFRFNSSKYNVDTLTPISTEYIYDTIRFDVFPSVDSDELKNLFLTMIKVPIKKPAILKKVAAAMNAGDFSSLVSVVQSNRMDNFEDDLRDKGYTTQFKHDYARVFAIYFSTQNRQMAIALLRYILFIPCEDQANYDLFLNYVEGLSEEQRDAFIPKIVYNAYPI